MAQNLYTPFLANIGKSMGEGIQKRAENALAEDAYMKKPGALQKLMSVNPQLANQIQRQNVSDEQTKLNTDIRTEKSNLANADRKSKATRELQKVKSKVQEQIANFDDFGQASQYYNQQLEQNADLLQAAGINPESIRLKEEDFANIKKAFGVNKAFEVKRMKPQIANAMVRGANDPKFRKTPDYAYAWGEYTKPKIIKTATGDILLPPDINPMFKAPNEKDIPEADEIKSIAKKAKKDADEINYIKGTKKELKTTEGEKLSGGYYGRMINSEENILKLGKFNPASPKEVALGVSNVTASEDMQLYRQAADDWIRAKLRKESGAVIGEDEMKKEYQVYFPRLGDSVAVMAQKKKSRKIAMDAMKANAGNFIKQQDKNKESTDESALPSNVTEAQMKYTMDKYKMTREEVISKLRGR